MSSLTHLCLNRLDADPYLHRIIPHLTYFMQDHPGEKLIIISDKELLTKGLYLSLMENEIPVQLYSQYQAIPLNILNGTHDEVFRRFKSLGLLDLPTPRSGTEALLNQTSYLALTHALTVIKTVKGNIASLHDLNRLLNPSIHQPNGSQLLAQFQRMPVIDEGTRQHHLEVLSWFLNEYFPLLTKKEAPGHTFEYAALGRLRLEQFEQEWRSLFPCQGVEHRLDLLLKPEVLIIDVHHLTQIKHAVVSYLIETLSQANQKNKVLNLFLDISHPLTDEQWSECLINHQIEITQTQHVPKEEVSLNSIYDARSIKHLQYYNISNKPALLQAIQQFKYPGQLYYEKQRQLEAMKREEILKTMVSSLQKNKSPQRDTVEEDWVVDLS